MGERRGEEGRDREGRLDGRRGASRVRTVRTEDGEAAQSPSIERSRLQITAGLGGEGRAKAARAPLSLRSE